MRLTSVSLIVALGLAMAATGCQEPTARSTEVDRTVNRALVTHYNDAAIDNAIVTQKTLYDYCFVRDSEKLNELGTYNLEVLARHYRDNPGRLSIWKGDTPHDLYRARVTYVRSQLQEKGVDMGKMQIADSMPGGPGEPSDDAIEAYKSDEGISPSYGGGIQTVPMTE